MNSNNKSVIYALIAVLSWSTVATAFKLSLTYFSNYEMLLVACLTSLFIFTLLITVKKKWRCISELSYGQWLYFSLIGLLNPVAYYLVLFKAYDLLPAQIAQPINYTWPIVLLIFLAVFAKQPIPKEKYIGMFLSLLGVGVISLGGSNVNSLSLPVNGLLLAALSAALWAFYWIANNMNKMKVDGYVTLFMTFFMGSIYLLIGTFFVDVNLDNISGILSSMYVGAFEMGIPFIFFAMAISKTSNPALINQLCYLSPFMSLFFISVFLGEKIVFTTYIGLILIVLGLIFNQYIVKLYPYMKNKKNNISNNQ